jgi:hypothetical protein
MRRAATRSDDVLTVSRSRLTLRSTSIAGWRPACAISRDSTTWPSSRPRIASDSGSFRSSPSISTV